MLTDKLTTKKRSIQPIEMTKARFQESENVVFKNKVFTPLFPPEKPPVTRTSSRNLYLEF